MGRMPKYPDAEEVISAFYQSVSDAYISPGKGEQGWEGKKKHELLAEEFGISRIKVRKILVTTGDISSPAGITSLLASGLKIDEIAQKLNMSKSTVNSWIGYSKGVYGLDVSAAADRTQLCRERKEAVKQLQKAVEGEDWRLPLWKAITLFQSYPFTTSGRGSKPGVKFKYTVSQETGTGGRHYDGDNVEGYGNEMWISGKEKSISRSTVERAMKTALEMGGKVKGPKALNVPGVHSYLYPILVRFGVIDP